MTTSKMTPKEVGYKVADMLFRNFSRYPDWQGEKFTWNSLIEMAGGQAEILSPWWNKSKKQTKKREECIFYAKERAKQLADKKNGIKSTKPSSKKKSSDISPN